MNSTGMPEFTVEYVIYRTRKGFRVVGKIHQPLDTFKMPVQLRIDTEGNPEMKTVDVAGTESPNSWKKRLGGRSPPASGSIQINRSEKHAGPAGAGGDRPRRRTCRSREIL